RDLIVTGVQTCALPICLLLRELLPCLDALAARARRALVLSGYLAGERAKLDAALAGGEWRCVRESSEIQSGDRWCARLLHHAARSEERRVGKEGRAPGT